MTDQTWEACLETELRVLLWEYPALRELLDALQIPLFENMPLRELPLAVSDRWLRDRGYTPDTLFTVIRELLTDSRQEEQLSETRDERREKLLNELDELEVYGGHDKDGNPENQSLTLHRGETLCVTGPTGSGKSRLLEDIECLAAGDTPSGRKVGLNRKQPTSQERELLENRLCTYLSQSMNFVMDLSCREFVLLHAQCRRLSEPEKRLTDVLDCANRLAGEPFDESTPVTQLSGGQSRAFMIADLVHISAAPVVLIDEPENAGIDKYAAIELLKGSGKIVLISTHDPVLALSCEKRITLKNGAVQSLRIRSGREEALLRELRSMDCRMQKVRETLRGGGEL